MIASIGSDGGELGGSQVRCDLDAEREGGGGGDESSGSFGGQGSLLPPEGTLGATARALMARGRKLSTIYSRVSAASGGSSFPGMDSQARAAPSRKLPASQHARCRAALQSPDVCSCCTWHFTQQ